MGQVIVFVQAHQRSRGESVQRLRQPGYSRYLWPCFLIESVAAKKIQAEFHYQFSCIVTVVHGENSRQSKSFIQLER